MGYESSFEWKDLLYKDKIGLMHFVMLNQDKSDKSEAEQFFANAVEVLCQIDAPIFPEETVKVEWVLKWSENQTSVHYLDEEWTKWIAPFIESGELKFSGEEGYIWKYIFNNGIINKIIFV